LDWYRVKVFFLATDSDLFNPEVWTEIVFPIDCLLLSLSSWPLVSGTETGKLKLASENYESLFLFYEMEKILSIQVWVIIYLFFWPIRQWLYNGIYDFYIKFYYKNLWRSA